ncbi:MAG: hypothetical protein V4502_01905, partial [Pseudomonadota bacterium]
MNSRLGLFGFLAALAVWAAQAGPPANPIVGTWKLNVAKSKFDPGPGWQSQVRTYALAPDGGVAVDWTGVGAHGEPMRVHFISRLDGKDYPMAGSANYDTLNAVNLRSHATLQED